MIAYKFLRAGRIGAFSQFHWPQPGVWVKANAALALCRSGIHACRTRDLPWWLDEELWEIELRGRVHVAEHKIMAHKGRLRSPVAAWTPDCASEYAHACAWRARDRALDSLIRAGRNEAADTLAACGTLGELVDSARKLADALPEARVGLTIAGDSASNALAGALPTSAYIAAHLALRIDGPAAYDAERAWQSRWLVQRLGLSDTR